MMKPVASMSWLSKKFCVLPDVEPSEQARFIQGVSQKNGEWLILVELDKLLNEDELSELDQN